MQYLKPIKGLPINEKKTLAGKFFSFIGGQISQGWNKLKLKDLSIQWTQEYAKAMDAVLKERLDNIHLEAPEAVSKTRKPSMGGTMTKKSKAKLDVFIEKLTKHFYMMHILTNAHRIVDIVNTANEGKYSEAETILSDLKSINTNQYDAYFSDNADVLKFLHSLIALDKIDKSTKSNLSPFKLGAVSSSLNKLLTTLSNEENKYETDINTYIKNYKTQLEDLDTKINSETDSKKKVKFEETKKTITDIVETLKKLASEIGLVINEATRTGAFSAVSGLLSNLKDKAKGLTQLGDTIGDSIDSLFSSVGDDIAKLEISEDEKTEITNKVNIKRLKVIQFTAETIYKKDEQVDTKLKNYWDKLLLEMDDKFQNAVNVDKIKGDVKTAELDKKVANHIKLEAELITDAENSGITYSTNNFKKVNIDTPVIMGVRSSNNRLGYLVLKKAQSGSNWFMLLKVYDKDKKEIHDFFGKGLNERYLNNDIPIYLSTEIKTGNNKYIGLLYNYTNGNLYNNTKDGATFDETKKEFDRLGVDTTRKFMGLTYKDVKPDTNKRTFNVVVSGTSDSEKIKEIYKLDIAKFKLKKSSFTTAVKNHKEVISYFNNLRKK